jgi:hypothetical protein
MLVHLAASDPEAASSLFSLKAQRPAPVNAYLMVKMMIVPAKI